MPFHIRPFMPDDYAAMLAIDRVIYPDFAATEDEARYWDEHRDPTHRFQRWVAEQNDRVVGAEEITGQQLLIRHQRCCTFGRRKDALNFRPVPGGIQNFRVGGGQGQPSTLFQDF